MENANLEQILAHARALPEVDRARLVYDLQATLGGSPDADIVAEWERDLERYLSEVRTTFEEQVSRLRLKESLAELTL